jgi:uncharacterized protein (DUF3820 family)
MSEPLSLEDILTFGKYKGETLNDIIKTQPQYVSWLLSNAEWFTINGEATALLKKTPQGYKPLGLHGIVRFGKYKGMLLEDVIKGDPNYIKFLLDNWKDLKLSEEAIQLVKVTKQPREQLVCVPYEEEVKPKHSKEELDKLTTLCEDFLPF